MRRPPCCNMVIGRKLPESIWARRRKTFPPNEQILREELFHFNLHRCLITVSLIQFGTKHRSGWDWVINGSDLWSLHPQFSHLLKPHISFIRWKVERLMVWWLFSISQSLNFDRKCESQKYKLAKFHHSDQYYNFKPSAFSLKCLYGHLAHLSKYSNWIWSFIFEMWQTWIKLMFQQILKGLITGMFQTASSSSRSPLNVVLSSDISLTQLFMFDLKTGFYIFDINVVRWEMFTFPTKNSITAELNFRPALSTCLPFSLPSIQTFFQSYNPPGCFLLVPP